MVPGNGVPFVLRSVDSEGGFEKWKHMTSRLSKLVVFDVLEEVRGQGLFGLFPIYNNHGDDNCTKRVCRLK